MDVDVWKYEYESTNVKMYGFTPYGFQNLVSATELGIFVPVFAFFLASQCFRLELNTILLKNFAKFFSILHESDIF